MLHWQIPIHYHIATLTKLTWCYHCHIATVLQWQISTQYHIAMVLQWQIHIHYHIATALHWQKYDCVTTAVPCCWHQHVTMLHWHPWRYANTVSDVLQSIAQCCGALSSCVCSTRIQAMRSMIPRTPPHATAWHPSLSTTKECTARTRIHPASTSSCPVSKDLSTKQGQMTKLPWCYQCCATMFTSTFHSVTVTLVLMCSNSSMLWCTF